eukprot:scaffold250755_cov15-Tisochrysis_lutea.AAC.1
MAGYARHAWRPPDMLGSARAVRTGVGSTALKAVHHHRVLQRQHTAHGALQTHANQLSLDRCSRHCLGPKRRGPSIAWRFVTLLCSPFCDAMHFESSRPAHVAHLGPQTSGQ